MSSYLNLGEQYLRLKIENHTRETFERSDPQTNYAAIKDVLRLLDEERSKSRRLQRKNDIKYSAIEGLLKRVRELEEELSTYRISHEKTQQ